MVKHDNGNHKRSASCTALPALMPHSVSPSLSEKTQHSCQAAIPHDFSSHNKPLSLVSNNSNTTIHSISTSSTSSHGNMSDIDSASVASDRETGVCTPASQRSSWRQWQQDSANGPEHEPTMRSGLSSLLTKHRQPPFPLPGMCLFSPSALANERTSESDIVPYISPPTLPLERIHMLVGIFQSMLRVVLDMSVFHQNSYEPEEEDDWFQILSMTTFKIVLWDDRTLGDLGLVVLLPVHMSDKTVATRMETLRQSLTSTDHTNMEVEALGDLLASFVQQIFA